MSDPIVSVIIPTYNRASLLKKSLASVLEQSYSDFEVIVIDNASSDNTEKFCRTLAKTNFKIRYIKNKQNIGMVQNWNKGLSFSKGLYVGILMDDDFWDKDFLLESLSIFQQFKKLGMVGVKIVPFSDEKVPDYSDTRFNLNHISRYFKGHECIKRYLNNKWPVGLPSGILFRRSCFSQVGNFDLVGLDQELVLRICFQFDFFYLNRPLCFWRKPHTESFTNSLTPSVSFNSQILSLSRVWESDYARTFLSQEIQKKKEELYHQIIKEFKVRRLRFKDTIQILLKLVRIMPRHNLGPNVFQFLFTLIQRYG